jgi:DNA-binding beta-propeller fold protein YncE
MQPNFQRWYPVNMRSLYMVLSLLFGVVPAVAAEHAGLAIVDTIKGADGYWDYSTVDARLHRLYVARGDGVMVVNLLDGVVTPTLVPGNHVHRVLPLPNGLMISTNGGTGTATLFTAADGHVVADFATGKNPDSVVRDRQTGLLAVMNGGDGTVTLIDAANRKLAGDIVIGGKLEFAVADGHGRVFVNVEDKNEMVELDIPNRKVVKRYPLPGCDAPSGLALDNANHALVAACDNGVAVALSANDGKVLATLPIGKGPDAVIFDKADRRFLVPCGGDGVLTEIEEGANDTLTVIGTVPTARGAHSGARDPSSGRIYLPTAEFQPAQGHKRPVAKPGSFHILVLSPV